MSRLARSCALFALGWSLACLPACNRLTHADVVEQYVDVLADCATLLEGVDSTGSAKAAVPELEKLIVRIERLLEKKSGMTEPEDKTPAQERRYQLISDRFAKEWLRITLAGIRLGAEPEIVEILGPSLGRFSKLQIRSHRAA